MEELICIQTTLDQFINDNNLSLNKVEKYAITQAFSCEEEGTINETIVNLITQNNPDYIVDNDVTTFLENQENVALAIELWKYSRTTICKTKEGARSMSIYSTLATQDLLNLTAEEVNSGIFDPVMALAIGAKINQQMKQITNSTW